MITGCCSWCDIKQYMLYRLANNNIHYKISSYGK